MPCSLCGYYPNRYLFKCVKHNYFGVNHFIFLVDPGGYRAICGRVSNSAITIWPAIRVVPATGCLKSVLVPTGLFMACFLNAGRLVATLMDIGQALNAAG